LIEDVFERMHGRDASMIDGGARPIEKDRRDFLASHG
jgi:hypothetical protein